MISLEWKPVRLENLAELRQALALKNPEVSELSLANLFLWQEFDRPQMAKWENYIFLKLSPPNEPAYGLEPLGPLPTPSVLETCLRQVGRLSRLPATILPLLPAGKFIIKENRDQFDYLYSREEMVNLRGKKFDGKRNLLRRFRQACPDFEFKIIGQVEERQQKEILSFFLSWAKEKDRVNGLTSLGVEDQALALKNALDLWDDLGLLGGLLLYKREIKGFIVASRLNRDTAVVHFQYADLSSPGAAQTLLWEACLSLLQPFPLINLEQDLGIPGLRKAKLSYHPVRLIAKYDVEPLSSS